MHKLFVYGTLMNTKDFAKEPAVLCDHRMFAVSWFPGIKPFNRVAPDSPRHIVDGQILREISDEQLAMLDSYEGYPNLYVRPKVKVMLEDGSEEECWVYIYNHDTSWPDSETESGGNLVSCEKRGNDIFWNFEKK